MSDSSVDSVLFYFYFFIINFFYIYVRMNSFPRVYWTVINAVCCLFVLLHILSFQFNLFAF